MKSLFCLVSIIILTLTGCASIQDKKIVMEGYQFSTGKNREAVVEAIVATLQEENITISNINEKFGIVNTGIQDVPAATVVKWRGDSPQGLGIAVWKLEIGFSVNKSGDVKIKYCLQGSDPWTGAGSCVPHNTDRTVKYFEAKIMSKL